MRHLDDCYFSNKLLPSFKELKYTQQNKQREAMPKFTLTADIRSECKLFVTIDDIDVILLEEIYERNVEVEVEADSIEELPQTFSLDAEELNVEIVEDGDVNYEEVTLVSEIDDADLEAKIHEGLEDEEQLAEWKDDAYDEEPIGEFVYQWIEKGSSYS